MRSTDAMALALLGVDFVLINRRSIENIVRVDLSLNPFSYLFSDMRSILMVLAIILIEGALANLSLLTALLSALLDLPKVLW